ncbi:hypothetical protein ABKV19_016989 [Rosa sericea]
MGTNLESYYNMCQLAHPLLKASGAGNIVRISSIAGVISIGGSGSVYAATKGAINQLARYLAFEWGKDKIRINSIAPGFIFIRTPLAEDVISMLDFFRALLSFAENSFHIIFQLYIWILCLSMYSLYLSSCFSLF